MLLLAIPNAAFSPPRLEGYGPQQAAMHKALPRVYADCHKLLHQVTQRAIGTVL